jgi:putative acetyltransferase
MSDLDVTLQPVPRASAPPLISPTLLLFMVAMILANLGSEMYGPLLPLYLKELNASVAQIGLFFTLAQVVPLALQILGGWVSDSLGRLRSIAYGSVAGNLTYVGFILAPTWQWVMSGMIFSAMTRSLIGPSFSAYIAEQSTEQHRARVFGITDTLFMVVSVIGPPLGGYLADTYGFRSMLLCAWFLYILATVIRVGMARHAARSQASSSAKLSLASLRTSLGTMFGLLLSGGLITWILITDGVRDIAFALSGNLMPLYLEGVGGMSYQQIGWLGSVFGVCMMLVTIPAGWLADKKGERIGIVLGFLLQAAALMVFMYTSGFWGYALSWALFGIGVGMMAPAYNSLISKAVPEKVRGTAFGLFSTSLGLVSLPAPAIGAQMWERSSPRLPFWITALASLVSMAPAWLKFKLPSTPAAASDLPQAKEIEAWPNQPAPAPTSADYPAIRDQRASLACLQALVEAIRRDPVFIPELSLVAELTGQPGAVLVGHILFSPIAIQTPQGRVTAISLAPMAVLPAYQNQGIGSALVRAGLEACRQAGQRIAIVLGHLNFYPRFGFAPASRWGLNSPWPEAGDAFMAMELTPGALDEVQGKVVYPAYFEDV